MKNEMNRKKTLELAIFGMLGGVMYASKVIMELLPNVHMLGAFIVALTVVYRAKALYPIYVFVLLTGLFNGFNLWWVPYLYIWLPLWGAAMLLPGKLSPKAAPVIYCLISAMHGLCYGILYAPFQTLAFHMGWKGMLAWIAAGFPWDIVHACGNLATGLLICPLIKVFTLCNNSVYCNKSN